MSNKFKVVLALVFCLSCYAPQSCFAERPAQGIGQWLQEFGVFTGYMQGSLKQQEDLEAVPVGLRFGFDLKPFTKKFGFEPVGMLELIYEPFISAITEPDSNMEMGLPFFFRYSYPLTSKIYPFVEVGTGPYYMTLHTYEQSTQFNFVSQGGAGISYFLKENVAINIEYRKRHVSNASIKSPNGGLEANVYLLGMSYYF
ncbi:MAG: hypothetical protein AUJ74_02100 [Candidatus Omnitrophica bacterium CG1_02_44_16]|nr:MAG: hypothetical protein AUJ74_02100 [Candidatus Omnitrophica bacterium CG1_02_44_16]PIY83484.1 MAG: hypothetical protein COY78_02025 [Candidatus Omnitrophica bacterium CG_4_10_14_0_8_um_filter_44_12]PIZ84290.1 MAG: hypothetical protein COX96_04770 [Candidatus Omnitrophica bacterium CG_4_10_14_0_2_um_filter_44_9]